MLNLKEGLSHPQLCAWMEVIVLGPFHGFCCFPLEFAFLPSLPQMHIVLLGSLKTTLMSFFPECQ